MHHHYPFACFEAIHVDETLNFRTPGTLLEPWGMGEVSWVTRS